MTAPERRLRILLTGGGGFLGRAILREAERPEHGIALVRAYDLDCSRIAAPTEPGFTLETREGDVCDADALRAACEDIDLVIHSGSLVDWGQTTPEHLEAVNVGGTRNVIEACRAAGIRALVYTSTMDVVCGTDPVVDATEEMPFPETFTNDYARTKARAEEVVLAANDDALATCAVRPCGMYGEGDPYHVAGVLRVMKQGGLPFRPGGGSARFEHVYVGNVAHAHLLAARRMLEPGSPARGQAWFVTDDTPAVNFFDFMDPILDALGHPLPPRSRRMPYPIMLTIGAVAELAALVARPFKRFEPTITRSSVRFVCHTHTFDGSKAKRDLGYAPPYKASEALERTIAWWREEEDRETA